VRSNRPLLLAVATALALVAAASRVPAQEGQPAAPEAPAQAPAAPAAPGGVDTEKPFEEFPSSYSVERNEKSITAVRYGPNDKGVFEICPAKEGDPEGLTRAVLSDEDPYRVHVTVNENIIRAAVTTIAKRENGDGHLEAFNGSVESVPDTGGEECILPTVKPDLREGSVEVTQGRTRLTGQKLVYDESDGLAIVDGPITFTRPQKDDALNGTSERITINVDEETTFLEGDVVLKSRCRTSNAASVLYDDNAGIAILSGTPASTSEAGGENAITGDVIRYNLETNDVVVTSRDGKITGTFSDTTSDCK
jgi:lipopolysaccharide export system protein LptA